MITRCVEGGLPFGIHLIHASRLFDVGCKAKIAEVIKTYPDGKMDIVIGGLTRILLKDMYESKSYYEGEVEEYHDVDSEEKIDEDLFVSCVRSYNKIIELSFSGLGELLLQDYYSGESNLSFLMAQKGGLSLVQKQKILELRSENKRLEYLLRHFENVVPELRSQDAIKKVVMRDGYLKR